MQDNKKGSSFLVIIGIIMALALLGSCDYESDYERDSRSGFDKWSHGDFDSMTDSERSAVNDFLEWANDN